MCAALHTMTPRAWKGRGAPAVGVAGAMATVLFPLPDRDFDITEVAVPWRLLTRAGHTVAFATERGAIAAGDPLLLTGVVFGQLGADPEPRAFYAEMIESPEFLSPLPYVDIDVARIDGLWLAGGHAQGMRPYLESVVLRERTQAYWATRKPVAAICHGVLVLARAGVLAGVKTTCLPKYMELTAWSLTAWKHGDYYRTYPECVEDEVRRLGGDVQAGPITLVSKGTERSDAGAWIVEDGRYLSARWPGDAYLLARRFGALLG